MFMPMTPSPNSSRGNQACRTPLNPGESGLPCVAGLRVLGVELGHRAAAACAEWETVASDDFAREIADRTIVAGGVREADRFVHARQTDARTGDARETVYQRIAADRLADRSPHPAPWARLGRQFRVRIDGEDALARVASPDERAFAERLERELGYMGPRVDPLPERIDALLSRATRIARIGLRRHCDAARIGRAFDADAVQRATAAQNERILDALLCWADLAAFGDWTDEWADRAWAEHIGCERLGLLEDATDAERSAQRAEHERLFAPIARRLAASDTAALCAIWRKRWAERDASWAARLRELEGRVLPRGSDEETIEAVAARGVGGLSLSRIATVCDLACLQEEHAMRIGLDGRRPSAARLEGGCLPPSALADAVERLRERRVAQIADRILEAALEPGRECQAIVIGNLWDRTGGGATAPTEYESLWTRCAAEVRTRVEEAGRRRGILVRSVELDDAGERSSRTGQPGMRCSEFAVDPRTGQPAENSWYRAIWFAERRIAAGCGDTADEELSALARTLGEENAAERVNGRVVRLPQREGELFVETAPWFEIRDGRAPTDDAIEVELNAAANTALELLLDGATPSGRAA